MKRVGRAVREFHGKHGQFPLPALVAPDGTPLLRWRVLLLPHLDASDLYALFRLDEPWDSDPNRRLLQYLPAVYRIWGIGTEPAKTSLVTLRGPATAFPPARLISVEDCRDGAGDIPMAVIASRESAVAWTQPTDLPPDPEGRFVEQIDWRNDIANVLMCDATVQRLKRTLPADAWVLMAGRDDGNPNSRP